MSRFSRVLSFLIGASRRLVGEPLILAPRNQFTLIVVIALVALRVATGWHFFKEGSSKVHDRSFSSAAFLQSAKGPFAWMYHGLLPDEDGLQRLNYDPESEVGSRIDLKQTLVAWTVHRDRVSRYYRFDDQQRRSADRIYTAYELQLRSFFADNSADIEEYFRGIERREAHAADSSKREVPSLREQSAKVASDLRSRSAPWLAELDAMWTAYNNELNGLATPEQKRGKGGQPLELKKPGEAGYLLAEEIGEGRIAVRSSAKLFDVEFVNWFIPCFDIFIGILLILGLFTRPAAIVGALFLCTVMASQWPGTPGAMPVYYQAVEMLSLLVLASTGAGRIAGLDFFIVNWNRCRAELAPLVARLLQQLKPRSTGGAKDEPHT